MNILCVLNDQLTEPVDYVSRLTVKGVILNERQEVLLFGHSLIGGGVEEGEDFEDALARECLEEAGIAIAELKPLGTVIQYRDAFKKKYEVQGFLGKFVKQVSAPTTTSEREMHRSIEWKNIADAKQQLQLYIEEVSSPAQLATQEGDAKQAGRFNAQMALRFLEEAERLFGDLVT